MAVVQAEFLKSVSAPQQFPDEELPEIAFLGRSNVGKSSLLNALAGKHRLAFTSSTPGRTRNINFFRVDGKWIFADLPGYGFARVSQVEQQGWQQLVDSYLLGRRSLRLCLVLLDARRGWMESDLRLKGWLEHHQIPFKVVATKADKLNQKERNQAERAILKHYQDGSPLWFSALTGQGVKELWQTISKTTNR